MQLSEAWSTLGLPPSSTESQARSAFRATALKLHPDRNPGVDTTAEMQALNASMDRLTSHFNGTDNPSPLLGGGMYGFPFSFAGAHFHGGAGMGAHGQHDSEVDEWDGDEYECDSEEDEYEDMFFSSRGRAGAGRSGPQGFSVFDPLGGGFYFAGGRPQRAAPPRRPAETDRERVERLRRQNEERLARERLEKERARLAREYAEQRRQEESAKAAERRQSKKTAKRDRANAEREAAAIRAQEAKTLAQSKRSAVFAAAREGRSDVVRRAVWEEGVAESGGEAITADYALPTGVDRLETLLHIAAKRGDLELVQWLIGQGAAPDDRDAADLTPFHAALASKSVALIRWMLDQYSPKERENAGVTRPPEGESLISLALLSGKPEAVELLIAHSTVAQVAECWEWLDSVALGHADPSTAEREFAPLRAALLTRANFRPPSAVKPVPKAAAAEPPASWTAPSPRQQTRPSTQARPASAVMTPERSDGSAASASVSMSPAYSDLPPLKAPAFHALPPTPPATPPPPPTVVQDDAKAKPARRRRPRRKAPASSAA